MRTKRNSCFVDYTPCKLLQVLALTSLLISCLVSTTSAFVVRSHLSSFRQGSLDGSSTATSSSSTHDSSSSSVAAAAPSATNDDPSLRPVMVVGDAPAALGVVLALHTLEVLTGRVSLPNANDNKTTSPPRQQLVYHFPADAVNELPEFLDDLDDPILHFTVDDGKDSSGISTDLLTSDTMAAARAKIPFLGLQAITPREKITTAEPETLISEDVARVYSLRFQQILSGCSALDNIVVTLDLPLHLAMLHANCLPQAASSSTQHRNCFHVLKPDGGGVVTDYLYADDGSVRDPLSCKTQETIITSPPTVASASLSATAGAAYTALRGNGLDALASAAVSAAVSTMLADGTADTRTSVDWSTITSTVQLSKHIREFGVVSMPGEIRIRYRECGYR